MLELILLLDFALVPAHTCVRMQYSFYLESAFASFCDPHPFMTGDLAGLPDRLKFYRTNSFTQWVQKENPISMKISDGMAC
jgi:hypothetical protein